MSQLAVISGKGGTGKTFVSTNLAFIASAKRRTTYIDCDVEEPNGHLFLRPLEWKEESVSRLIPFVSDEKCDHCGLCAKACQFGAILAFAKKTHILSELCHSCGACSLACPRGAIQDREARMGLFKTGVIHPDLIYSMGLLDIGEMSGVRLIRKLKESVLSQDRLFILDSSPGVSCPVVETIKNTDFVLAVTEPSPMGLHDLKSAVELLVKINLPYGIVINRYEDMYPEMEDFINGTGTKFTYKMPFDRTAAEIYASGGLTAEKDPAWKERFAVLWNTIEGVMQ